MERRRGDAAEPGRKPLKLRIQWSFTAVRESPCPFGIPAAHRAPFGRDDWMGVASGTVTQELPQPS